MSRKRAAESVSVPSSTPERKRACWGVLISQGSWADRSPLHDAASQGRLLILRRLLAEESVKAAYPVHRPLVMKSDNYTALFVYNGYHVNIKTIDQVTPLHEACLSGHVACVRALLSAGANVNAATIDGVTPLYNCCASGSVGCMELLLQNGAHMHTLHTHFPSSMHEACRRGNSQCVETLLSHGADPDHQVPHLGSPLYVSCLHRHTACSKVLLDKGASVNAGKGGESPLHVAARQNSTDLVSVLLDHGAETKLRDGSGQRPLDLAPPGGETHQLLVAFEASPRSLCQLCRLRIRTVIGRARLKHLPLLPLPSLLTQYLEHT
uniref:Ankyrin repeat and SOCS box containing 5 n=1 Tax=Poecilia latipinna TaxID=48699 RepID=A0A3B3V8N4_9TELE